MRFQSIPDPTDTPPTFDGPTDAPPVFEEQPVSGVEFTPPASNGFDPSAATELGLTAPTIVAVAFVVLGIVGVGAYVALILLGRGRSKFAGLSFAAALLGLGLGAAIPALTTDASTAPASPDSAALTEWAGDVYGVTFSENQAATLLAGDSVAAEYLGERREVSLLEGGDGLLYLFDRYGQVPTVEDLVIGAQTDPSLPDPSEIDK